MKGLLHFLRTATTRQRHKGVPAYTAPNQTIRDILRSHLTERSHAPAIWVAPQQYRTFREVFDVVDRLAHTVRSLVDIPHPRIALATPRGSAGLFGFLAAVEVGTCCPLDAKLTSHEFADALVALGADVLLTMESDSVALAAARAAGISCVSFGLKRVANRLLGEHLSRPTGDRGSPAARFAPSARRGSAGHTDAQ